MADVLRLENGEQRMFVERAADGSGRRLVAVYRDRDDAWGNVLELTPDQAAELATFLVAESGDLR